MMGKAALDELKLLRVALQQEISQIESDPANISVNTEQLEKAKADLAQLDEQIQNLSQFEDIPDPYESIINSGKALISQSEAIYKASSLIGKGFTVAADDVSKLRQLMPELLVGAEQVGQGTIKLSKATMESVLGDQLSIVEGDSSSTKEQIKNKGFITLA